MFSFQVTVKKLMVHVIVQLVINVTIIAAAYVDFIVGMKIFVENSKILQVPSNLAASTKSFAGNV